ncbi:MULTISPECIES: 30S ribosomal protein S1 [Desulfococcus]|uniref:RNA binding S1 domain protein n=1 Tax=Desulfococcus multivorans DSM 2059 TaxID=1121405 RepID=S7TWH3_DESML|nr:30S ribosomal protein S1 [Desulfococcus multivorans]AOY60329.1 RpsA: 30S ribosomal protein S1 [Desulfococcus multivorans]AQV02434.1 30S ribosomal protein S1 [Desulfococcus multivorans]EPR41115.1 RNA binding S1 domain protein [Desulfococcus multivorans DSM 2059]SJZ58997.1 SSU ribosomal protein S1P [Desulfococcus multivorans DSM 2059]
MSDNFENDYTEDGEESFADMFASFDADAGEDLQVGDKVKAEIIAIGMDTVFVNTGAKIDGAVDKTELLDENGEFPYGIGDILELYVVAFDENEMRLSKAFSGIGSLNLLQDAFAGKVPVEGKVKAPCKGGFNVTIMGRRAFCPVSQIDTRYVENPEDYVGETFLFTITRLEENGRNIVISRRRLLEEEQEKAKKAFMETIGVGSILEGRVANMMPYGAFVELFPGVEGMIHVSELGWSRVDTPEAVLKKGDPVTVKVIGMEEGKKKGQVKIALSIKQISGDPWETEAPGFKAGDRIQGRVTRLMGFGAFVEIAPGIEGLVHISEMSYTRRVTRPDDVVASGETVDVVIKDVDLENRRISLSIRDAQGDPWADIDEKYTPGRQAEGTVEKKEKFGYFVNIAPGVTGLMPRSKISQSAKAAEIDRLKVGDPISVVIEEVQPDTRRLTLAPVGGEGTGEWKTYAKPQAAALGTLGEKLKEAMKSQKK